MRRLPNKLDKSLPHKAGSYAGTADPAIQQVEVQEQHEIQNSSSEENAGSPCALFTWTSMPAMSIFCEKYSHCQGVWGRFVVLQERSPHPTRLVMLPGAAWSIAVSSGSSLTAGGKPGKRSLEESNEWSEVDELSCWRAWKNYVCIGLQRWNYRGCFGEDISSWMQERSVELCMIICSSPLVWRQEVLELLQERLGWALEEIS